jgi:predicted nucleotidyltransferase component of viral defense system
MFYNILDKKRMAILPLLKEFKSDFYLAGGTALALQLGHRDSIDFDFFSVKNIDTEKLFERIKTIFVDYEVKKIQEEKNTLTIIIDENIKISFFTYRYELLNELINEENLKLASIEDIACMKLSAIVSRSTEKDYVDLYFILQNNSLGNLLKLVQKKFPSLDTNLVIKSLTYFDDIVEEAINFKNEQKVSLEEIKIFLVEVVKKHL